ncbi:MAG: hypothetical protein AAF391_06345 [Bacteroidota bacterium]
MKISYLLIAFIFVFGMACSTNSGEHSHDHGEDTHEHGDHGHNHDGEDGHSHDHDQEEFDASDGTERQGDDNSLTEREDEVSVTVPAKKGVEYKLFLNQYGKLEYEWSTANAIHSDFHGEPTDYEQTKYFESYAIGKVNTMKGMITMPFAGSHGWYWKNETNEDVVVKLKTKGIYKIIGLKQ